MGTAGLDGQRPRSKLKGWGGRMGSSGSNFGSRQPNSVSSRARLQQAETRRERGEEYSSLLESVKVPID